MSTNTPNHGTSPTHEQKEQQTPGLDCKETGAGYNKLEDLLTINNLDMYNKDRFSLLCKSLIDDSTFDGVRANYHNLIIELEKKQGSPLSQEQHNEILHDVFANIISEELGLQDSTVERPLQYLQEEMQLQGKTKQSIKQLQTESETIIEKINDYSELNPISLKYGGRNIEQVVDTITNAIPLLTKILETDSMYGHTGNIFLPNRQYDLNNKNGLIEALYSLETDLTSYVRAFFHTEQPLGEATLSANQIKGIVSGEEEHHGIRIKDLPHGAEETLKTFIQEVEGVISEYEKYITPDTIQIIKRQEYFEPQFRIDINLKQASEMLTLEKDIQQAQGRYEKTVSTLQKMTDHNTKLTDEIQNLEDSKPLFGKNKQGLTKKQINRLIEEKEQEMYGYDKRNSAESDELNTKRTLENLKSDQTLSEYLKSPTYYTSIEGRQNPSPIHTLLDQVGDSLNQQLEITHSEKHQETINERIRGLSQCKLEIISCNSLQSLKEKITDTTEYIKTIYQGMQNIGKEKIKKRIDNENTFKHDILTFKKHASTAKMNFLNSREEMRSKDRFVSM